MDTRHLKGEFGLEIQSYVERAHAKSITPSGRSMLAMLSRRYRVDRVRGVTVTQQTLLAVNLEGFTYSQMVNFKEKVEYILNGMPPEAWPADNTLFSWFYSKIKSSRGMQRIIDKVKDSKEKSKMRTFAWLWEQFSDHIAELREDQNERDFREAMLRSSQVRATPAIPPPLTTTNPKSTPAGPIVPPPKKPNPKKPPGPPAKPKGKGKGNGFKGKGKGKGKGGNDAKPSPPPPKQGNDGAKAKPTVPCIFYPKGTCNRGTDCPFAHEAKATPAKQSGSKAAAKTSAAVAFVLPSAAPARATSPKSHAGNFATRSHVMTGLNAFWRTLTCWATVLSTVWFPLIFYSCSCYPCLAVYAGRYPHGFPRWDHLWA